MAHFVDSRCVDCKDTACVDVCPVDCFFEGENFLVIHPDECIDCEICIEACPPGAIIYDINSEHDVEKTLFWLNFGREMIEVYNWKRIVNSKKPLQKCEKLTLSTNKTDLIIKKNEK